LRISTYGIHLMLRGFLLVNGVSMWSESSDCDTITNYTAVIQQKDRNKAISATGTECSRRSTSAGFRPSAEVASNGLRGNPR
jgi:hypothetical protein